MGQHAGDRGRRRGVRVLPEAWGVFLVHLATKSAIEASKLPGMPSAPAFNAKRKRDPQFHDRATAIMAARRPNNRGHIYPPEVWAACIANIGKVGIQRTSLMPGMPSFPGIYMKFWRDKEFRARVTSVRPRDKRHVGECLQLQLRGDAIYAAINDALPAHIDPNHRDDIAADMMVAVLEKKMELSEIKSRAAEFIRGHWRMFGQHRTVSLDVPVFPGSRDTIGDRLSGKASSFWA